MATSDSPNPQERRNIANDEAQKDRIIQHEYDGIQEYDNPMPRWWLLTFAGTVIFSVLYLFNIGPIGNGKGRIADYNESMAQYAAQHPEPVGDVTTAQLMALANDAGAVEAGGKVFASYCSSCHRADGGGMIGPNLTDDYWLHGATPENIHTVVADGVLDKGMPPWAKVLKPEQINQVVAYITTLHGTNPPNPKPPQGDPAQP
jgi:cytochrome c oxidase cbb3-type subunit 3